MELGINLGFYRSDKGDISLEALLEGAKFCRELGFTALDFLTSYDREDWEERAKRFREMLDENGLKIHQGHAPYNRYGRYESKEIFEERFRRSIEIAGILGAKYVAVHADEYITPKGIPYNGGRIRQLMYDFLAPYVEHAIKLGIGIAIENLFEGPEDPVRHRYTSKIEELLSLIEMFGDKAVSCCWDFGHAKCAYPYGKNEDFEAFKQAFKYITCTHAHDNYYIRDMHLVPTLGSIDWDSHIKYMKQNGYKGNFTLELVYHKMPDEILKQYMRLASTAGKQLIAVN